MANFDLFFQRLEERSRWTNEYLLQEKYLNRFAPLDIREAVTSYIKYGGKRLRPAILLFSCGAVGCDELRALPAAAAVEVFHTWTLVHDDIIDRDGTRRGQDTVHEQFRKLSLQRSKHPLSPSNAEHYGISVAILAGDVQHGWGISMMTELATERGVSPDLVIRLINILDTFVLNTLVEGELLDVQYSHLPVYEVSEEQVLDMLWRKTGALYQFCAEAGAMIGLNRFEPEHPYVQSLGRFCSLCGIAFQLQDDVLGIVGDEKVLGKPVGSDLREGKHTTIVSYAYSQANPAEKQWMERVLGKSDATYDEIRKVTEFFIHCGALDYTIQKAKKYIQEAVPLLNQLPETEYRQLMEAWAEFLIHRTF
ncbi:MAG: polyprenyl synthetase family protein [bacterium]|nr:polyprenyl synthetase family protein [bacterium]